MVQRADNMEEHREAEKWELLGCDELLYWKLEADARKDKEFYANQEEEEE